MTRAVDDSHDAAASPLWPLTVILGDVARRVERQRAAEHTEASPETRHSAGSDPAAPGETA
ncbi:MAG: hypothetical protein M3Q71_17550 [Chloroflexota bacterium]|nr:hypothetical protein [Chloroflexota bacterium]MDP9472445.1 hypothetical protein [Chloroflexota bacterium]